VIIQVISVNPGGKEAHVETTKVKDPPTSMLDELFVCLYEEVEIKSREKWQKYYKPVRDSLHHHDGFVCTPKELVLDFLLEFTSLGRLFLFYFLT